MDGSGGPVFHLIEAWICFLLPPADPPCSGKGITIGSVFDKVYSHKQLGAQRTSRGTYGGSSRVTKLLEHCECSTKPAHGGGRTRTRESGNDTRGDTARGTEGDPGLRSSSALPRLPPLPRVLA